MAKILTKKIGLEKAKKVLENEKVFLRGDMFSVFDGGRYSEYKSGITFEIPQKWRVNRKAEPVSPLQYDVCREITANLNIDFDANSVEVMFGKYRVSQSGKPVFRITRPTAASHILVRAEWGGGCGCPTRGQDEWRIEHFAQGVLWFAHRRSRGGGEGIDYYIVPVNFVANCEGEDRSMILRGIEERQDAAAEMASEEARVLLKARKESRTNREAVLDEIRPLFDELSAFDEGYKLKEIGEEDAIISGRFFESSLEYWRPRLYNEALVEEVSSALRAEKDQKAAYEKYAPLFRELEQALPADIHVNWCGYSNSPKRYIRVVADWQYESDAQCFDYTASDYVKFVNHLDVLLEEHHNRQEAARRRAAEAEAEAAAQLTQKKADAKAAGYPETYEHWHRTGGAGGGHAYVIESDGTIREPDYIVSAKRGRRFEDVSPRVDGDQGYEQILPGELIVAYTKGLTKEPFVFTVDWADAHPTEEQEATLRAIWGDLRCDDFAETKDGYSIPDADTFLDFVYDETQHIINED